MNEQWLDKEAYDTIRDIIPNLAYGLEILPPCVRASEATESARRLGASPTMENLILGAANYLDEVQKW